MIHDNHEHCVAGWGLQTISGQLAPLFFRSERAALAAAKARRKKQAVMPVTLIRGHPWQKPAK